MRVGEWRPRVNGDKGKHQLNGGEMVALNGGLACRKTRVFVGNSTLFGGGKNSAGPLTPCLVAESQFNH